MQTLGPPFYYYYFEEFDRHLVELRDFSFYAQDWPLKLPEGTYVVPIIRIEIKRMQVTCLTPELSFCHFPSFPSIEYV